MLYQPFIYLLFVNVSKSNKVKLHFTQFLCNSLFFILKISIGREFVTQFQPDNLNIHFSKSLDLILTNFDFWNRLYLLSFVYGDHPFLSWLTSFKQASFCNKKNMLKALLCLTTETWYAIEFTMGWKQNWKRIVIFLNMHLYENFPHFLIVFTLHSSQKSNWILS